MPNPHDPNNSKWTYEEDKLLLRFVHVSLIGGKCLSYHTWPEIAQSMSEYARNFFIQARSFTPQQCKNHYLYDVKPFWEERRRNIQRAKADADARDAREAAQRGVVVKAAVGPGAVGQGRPVVGGRAWGRGDEG